MKIQNLAVIFIIIILPISMVLTVYVQNQVQTLQLQVSYDTKLTNATYDALKAFQLNTVNSSTSDLANSKLRDIEASVNSFFNSIASNFNMSGYNKDILKEYVPAIVYTMYDGYYIYSPFTNTLTSEDYQPGVSTYQDGEKISGLKPYIFYSCRYIKGGTDVVITYTMDNYITVQGTVEGEGAVYRYGYLLDNVEGSYDPSTESNSTTYRSIPIETEELSEYIDDTNQARYTKINGVKYYLDESNGTWYSLLNGQRTYQGDDVDYKTTNDAGVRYYQEAKEFTDWIRSTNLVNLTTNDAVYEDGNTTKVDDDGVSKTLAQKEQWGNEKIFQDSSGISIEDPNSNFNEHRLQVIRYSIERNLSIAIANYNKYDGGNSTNFQMPELEEYEWEKILNNVSIISFMQGLSIGGKVYNGYSIVTNTKTEEVVNLDSIYITTSDGQYYRATDTNLSGTNNNSSYITGAYFNIDFERNSIVPTDGTATTYFYPHGETGSYTSIVNQSGTDDLSGYNDNIYAYMADTSHGQGGELATKYFTALGRERYSMYKTNNNPELLKVNFVDETYSGEIEPHGLGDINNDGDVNVYDLRALMYHINGNTVITDEETLRRCDINNDGNINEDDLRLLLRYVTKGD